MQEHKFEFSTALFSDVLDDLGYNNQIFPIEINLILLKPKYLDAQEQ